MPPPVVPPAAVPLIRKAVGILLVLVHNLHSLRAQSLLSLGTRTGDGVSIACELAQLLVQDSKPVSVAMELTVFLSKVHWLQLLLALL